MTSCLFFTSHNLHWWAPVTPCLFYLGKFRFFCINQQAVKSHHDVEECRSSQVLYPLWAERTGCGSWGAWAMLNNAPLGISSYPFPFSVEGSIGIWHMVKILDCWTRSITCSFQGIYLISSSPVGSSLWKEKQAVLTGLFCFPFYYITTWVSEQRIHPFLKTRTEMRKIQGGSGGKETKKADLSVHVPKGHR